MTSGERIVVGFLTLIIIASCLFVIAIGREERDTAAALAVLARRAFSLFFLAFVVLFVWWLL